MAARYPTVGLPCDNRRFTGVVVKWKKGKRADGAYFGHLNIESIRVYM